MVQLYNTKDHAIIIKKGTVVAPMVATNEVPETGCGWEPFKLEGGPMKYYVTVDLLLEFWQTPMEESSNSTPLSLKEHWDFSSVSTCPLGYAMLQQLSSD